MAELKYDLQLVQTLTSKKIREQPWWRERLQTKFIKSLNPGETSQVLLGRKWRFLKDGIDDFRDGLPPANDDQEFLTRDSKVSPIIVGGSQESLSQIKDTVNRHRFTKDDICFSKLTPLQKMRRSHIAEIENGLLQHPLALYPHLEGSMPPDLFEDVVNVLDPDMNLSETESDDEDADQFDADGSQAEHLSSIAGYQMRGSSAPYSPATPQSATADRDEPARVRNLYRWASSKEEKKSRKRGPEKRTESPSQDDHIKQVTKDFCGWVAGLGGETNNIEESTIYSLFASGYETKPALSVPIHVVELTNIPPELRMAAAIPQEDLQAKPVSEKEQKKEDWKYFSGSYMPSWVKFNYGAWYLNPRSWHKRDSNEPLRDPKESKDQGQTDIRKKSDTLDYELAPNHGSKAFIDFIDKKQGARKPEFLSRIGAIQKKAAEDEERARLEAEAKARSKSRRASQKPPAPAQQQS